METTESGIVLPFTRERVVAPVPGPRPWLGGEQAKDATAPLFWLDLQREVREQWGPGLARLHRAVHGRV